MYYKDLELLLSLLNSNVDIQDIIIKFEHGYNIEFDSNGIPHLYSSKEYLGVYDNYFIELLEEGGIFIEKWIDSGVTIKGEVMEVPKMELHNFTGFTFCGNYEDIMKLLLE